MEGAARCSSRAPPWQGGGPHMGASSCQPGPTPSPLAPTLLLPWRSFTKGTAQVSARGPTPPAPHSPLPLEGPRARLQLPLSCFPACPALPTSCSRLPECTWPGTLLKGQRAPSGRYLRCPGPGLGALVGTGGDGSFAPLGATCRAKPREGGGSLPTSPPIKRVPPLPPLSPRALA